MQMFKGATVQKSMSRRSVLCGKCELPCSNWTNLQIHFQRYHPNEKVLKKVLVESPPRRREEKY